MIPSHQAIPITLNSSTYFTIVVSEGKKMVFGGKPGDMKGQNEGG